MFKPSIALSATNEPKKNERGVASAANTLMSPLLKSPQEPYIHKSTIGKVQDFLNRIVIVLSRGTTLEAGDILNFLYMTVFPFVSWGKPIESNKNEEEYDKIEIEEKSHIKIIYKDKNQSATNTKSIKATINRTSVFQLNTSSLHAAKDSRMAHEKNRKKRQNWERLLMVSIHQKWLASHGRSLLNLLIIMVWRSQHLQVLSILAKSFPSKLFRLFILAKLLWRPVC